MGFYYDDAGNLNTELLDEQAKQYAEKFVNDQEKQLNSNQLRRFYNECKNLERRFEFACQQQSNDENGQQAAFLKVLPLLKMLKAKVSYATNPSNKKIPGSFARWLTTSIDAVENEQDFRAFLLSFEAVVGFCYGEGIAKVR